MRTEYRIVVTYGTRKDQTYATVPERASAEKLRQTARELGYRDARIETVQVEERRLARHVRQAEEPPGPGPAVQDAPAPSSRELHDLRAQSQPALAV